MKRFVSLSLCALLFIGCTRGKSKQPAGDGTPSASPSATAESPTAPKAANEWQAGDLPRSVLEGEPRTGEGAPSAPAACPGSHSPRSPSALYHAGWCTRAQRFATVPRVIARKVPGCAAVPS